MKLLFCSLVLATTSAMAGPAPVSEPTPTPTPTVTPEPYVVGLKTADMQTLQAFVNGAGVMVRADDGSEHPMVDGLLLLNFLKSKAVH